jgi:hypothetical protein
MGEPFGNPTGIILNENGRIPTATALFENYEILLYAFYNKEIDIFDDDMQIALEHALHMLEIATYLGCVPVISKPIDVALIKHGQDLFRAIQRAPWAWVGLAIRIKSDIIYQESVVHLAGNWRKISEDKVAMARLRQCPEEVRALCKKLHKGLINKGKKLELALASLYPGGMAQPTDDIPIKREEYAKEILVWMALSFFRHWLGQRIIMEKGSAAPDGGYELYSQIGRSGEAYMDKVILNQFHQKFPMTKKAMNVLENHLLEIKEVMKGVVEAHGVLKHTCMLDTMRYPVDYLTCAEVKKEDLPWTTKTTAQRAESLKRSMRPGGSGNALRNQTAERLQVNTEQDIDADEEDNSYVSNGENAKRARHV